MVVCKFFLQGTCKFGSMCKFEHEINDNSYQTSGTSILRTSNFGSANSNSNFGATNFTQPKLNPLILPEKTSVDINTLIKTVVSDMTQAEKGGQWLFSSYAPFKEKPAFPGFEDQSFEEMRYGYYEAVKAGTTEQFKQQIQSMAQEVLMKVRSLQNPSSDIANILVNIYNSPPSSQGAYTGNNFTSTSNTNFSFKSGGISQQSTSIFAQANQNLFGNSQPTQQQHQQQQQQQQSIFNSPENKQNSQMFGNQLMGSNNIFAQANNNLGMQNNTSIFGASQSTAAAKSGSVFGNNVQPINSNVFAPPNQQNVFQPVAQTQNIFASSNNVGKSPLLPTPTAQVPNIFSNNNNNNISTKTPLLPTPPSSIFSAPPNNQQLIQPQQNQTAQSSVFYPASNFPNSNAAPNKTEIAQGYSNSIFNKVDMNSPGMQRVPDQSLYSKLEDLSEEDIKWFQSADLDILNIPEKPPTYEMCFKM